MPSNTTTSVCPPAGDLERLVRGRLTEARAAALADHVGVCVGCQIRLDALAGGNANELTTNLRICQKDTPPTDSAYWKAISAVEAEVRTTGVFANAPSDSPDGGLPLDFLQPANEVGRLGTLGSFGIIRVVGRGGMGVVLHAYDPCLARDVAVKVIDPKLANNEVARQRFCREARAAAAVTHDNLVAVHQVDEDEASGLPYLVMQLINGESLEQRLKRVGKLPPVEVARLGMQAAAGLAAAHAGGLIHRDIKPGNILLEAPSDRVKLTDFGLARAVEDVKLTRTGFVAGSPLYMAPEQARGDDVDHRADLFSLGSVLYEAATGTPPFEAKTPLAVLRRVSDEIPRSLAEVDPEIPDWLSEIVDKLLAKDAGNRQQTAAEVAEAFAGELARSHGLSPLDVPADLCSGSSRSGTATHRKRICWKGVAYRGTPWIGGMGLGALALALVWSPSGVEKVIEKPVEVHASPSPAETGPTPKVVLQGEPGTVWTIAFLGEDRLVVGMDDGQVKIWDIKKGAVSKALEPRQGGTVWSVDVSADGKRLATTCDASVVTVWNLETYKVENSFPQPTSTKAAVFSPDGSKVATGDRNATIRVWDIAAQIPVELRGHHGTVHSLAFSPDGTKLASAGSDGTAKVWNWADPTAEPVGLGEHKGPVYGIAYSPDGTKLATTGWDGTVRIWNAALGSVIQTIKAHDGDAWSVAFGNGGKWVASAGQDGVKVWDVDTGNEVFAYRGKRAFHVVRFAKDGTTLAAGGRDGTVRVWELTK
ncbi:MAG: serine/threonine protein kinase [Planctomycetes bacterium]|nr:serine/threonine protein kinase [Planctomycetota bacterium]